LIDGGRTRASATAQGERKQSSRQEPDKHPAPPSGYTQKKYSRDNSKEGEQLKPAMLQCSGGDQGIDGQSRGLARVGTIDDD
jgi:hypothetical protein